MKKFLKVLTSSLLVAAMVLTGLPGLPEIDFENLSIDFSNVFSGVTEVFAGKKGGDTHDSTDRKQVYNGEGVAIGANAARVVNNRDTYVLGVSMNNGVASDVCKYVIIRYYASEAHKQAGVVSTQYLAVNAGNDYGEDITKSSTYVTGKYAFLGAKSTSFYPFITNSSYSSAYFSGSTNLTSSIALGGTSYIVNGQTLLKNFDKYNNWAALATGETVSTDYPDAVSKSQSSAFPAANTEYIRFKFEYGFYELVNLSFYCEANSDKAGAIYSFGIRQWILYKHDGEYDEKNNFIPGSTTATNYAFVSNALALSFNGTKLYESVSYNPDDPSTYDYPDTMNMQGEGGCTFTFENAEKYDDYEDYNTGFNTIYFFQKCKGTDAEKKVRSDNKTILNFSINFADLYGSGIDAYINAKNFNECMYAEIEYYDTSNVLQVLYLPVITNALLEYAIPVDEDPYDSNPLISSGSAANRLNRLAAGDYMCFAHESDSIYFSVEFPNFRSLEGIEIKYDPLEADDYIVIDSIDVYNNNGVTQYPVRNMYRDNSVDGNSVDVTLNNCSVVYRTISDDSEIRLDVESNKYYFQFAPSDSEEVSPTTKVYKDKYLVTVTTINQEEAACWNDVNIVLGYKDFQGKEHVTTETSMLEASKEFYGYNDCTRSITKTTPDGQGGSTTTTTTVNDPNASYYYGMSAGQSLQFFIEASGVESFTSVTFAYADEKEYGDFWQPKHLKIEKVQEASVVGKLLCAKLDKTIPLHTTDGTKQTATITQIFGRNISGLKTYYDADIDTSLSNEGSDVYDFEEEDSEFTPGTEDEKKAAEKEKYRYALSSGLAASDLGLGDALVNYQVQVTVSGNSNALRDDDCGSNNKFYFQLCFASFGAAATKSAYVLANQQLTADGFRAGYTETFTISMNEQVGDVVGINIIPDDISADSAIDDKLCVTEITVVKQNKSNIDRCFVINDVGWITQEYVDTADAYTREQRSESELVKKYPVSYSSYMLELEFAMTWGSYDSASGGTVDTNDLTVFKGNLLADMTYTVSGENARQGVLSSQQCVQLMADYSGQTAIADDDLTFVSDPSYMFRAGHTNKFVIPIKQVSKINTVKFSAFASPDSEVTYIPLQSMSISIVTSAGSPRMDETTGDFYRNYNTDPILYCDTFSPNIQNYKLNGSANKSAGTIATQFKLKNAADISGLAETDKIQSVVTRLPASANDTLNVYLYLGEGTPGPKDGNYSMDIWVYTGILNSKTTKADHLTMGNGGSLKQDTATDLNGKTVNRVYSIGIDASNMESLKNLNVRAASLVGNSKASDYKVQYAIVQQVREGVVVNTYKVNFASDYFTLTPYGSSMGGASSAKKLGSSQLVTIQLAPDTATADLIAETYDIGVAIRYKSSVSGENAELVSPYVYASDAGVTSVHAGSILEFYFNEAYVSKIEGISIMSNNGLEASVSAATIKTFEETARDNGYDGQTAIYSIYRKLGEAQDISKGAVKMDATGTELTGNDKNVSTLKRANLSFEVMSDSVAGSIDSGGKDPIRAIINYTTVSDKAAKVEIPDIRQYSVDGTKFASGNTVNVSLFLQGAKSLTSVEIEPYDDDESSLASLNLASVGFQLDDVADTSQRIMCYGDTIYEGEPVAINLSTIKVMLETEYTVQGLGKKTDKITNGTINIVAQEDSEVIIRPTITDSNQGYTVRIYRLVSGTRVLIEKFASKDAEFKMPAENGTTETVEWLIEVSASELPTSDTAAGASQKSSAVKSYVKITVPSLEEDESLSMEKDDKTKESSETEKTNQ